MDRDYQGVTTEWMLCGASSLRFITLLSEKECADLGKRFIECIIIEDD